TALIRAANRGHTDIAKALIEAGAGLDIQNGEGATALIWATIEGYTDIATALLAAGADPKVQDNKGKTARHYAKENKEKALVKLLKAAEKGNIPRKEEAGFGSPKHNALPTEVLSVDTAAEELGIGDHTKRLLAQNTQARLEHDYIQDSVQTAVKRQLTEALIVQQNLGVQDLDQLKHVGASVQHRYNKGEPRWRVNLWVGEADKTLHPMIEEIAQAMRESLGDGAVNVIADDRRRGVSAHNQASMDGVIESINRITAKMVGAIDTAEIYGAARAQAIQKVGNPQPQAGLDLGR
ncbi:MAG: ankyrin repeat domain-containing protein, partial [Rickettsiales bacterium]